MCVNPLHVGELISTKMGKEHRSSFFWVSIPFTSGNSFLLETNNYRQSYNVCVNPLHVGELISTVINICTSLKPSSVSIPFTSGNSFLLYILCGSFTQHFLCQSPSRRGTHFYIKMFYGSEKTNSLCQSPSRRGTHFYDYVKMTPVPLGSVSIPFTSGNSFLRTNCSAVFPMSMKCVNPLHVGELISTRYSAH